jgi:hypothetical protein
LIFDRSYKVFKPVGEVRLNGDINVTSPTVLKTLYDLSKINLAKTFWKELKA